MSVRISGITFIKNGLTLGYPIKESIQSIENLCDEIIINVGFDREDLTGDDGTYEYLKENFKDPKFIFLKSYWDPSMTKSGLILSQQTNIAMEKASGKYIQYIQADEALHEKDHREILNAADKMDKNEKIEGIVFKYYHFYGNTNIVKRTKKTYRREIRLIRNQLGIKSWLDAQGFRTKDDKKLSCIEIDAHVYHYGWSRKECLMVEKTKAFEKLYHGDKKVIDSFEYKRVWGLYPFKGTHPQIMNDWIAENQNPIDPLSLKLDWSIKDIRLMLSDSFESLTGIRIGEYKNFNLL